MTALLLNYLWDTILAQSYFVLDFFLINIFHFNFSFHFNYHFYNFLMVL